MALKATFTITFSGEDPPITNTETHTFSIEEEMEEFLLAFAKKQEWDKGLGGEDDEETEEQVVEVLNDMGFSINLTEEEIENACSWFYWDPIFKFSPEGSAWMETGVDPEYKSVILEKI